MDCRTLLLEGDSSGTELQVTPVWFVICCRLRNNKQMLLVPFSCKEYFS
jgi:hypothetical protein